MKATLAIITLFVSLVFLACPKPSDNKPPEKADCDPGFLPCEEDSTICCEVICPPGTLLGGQDSTECIPVECPPNYHLCGPDSTDCCLDTTSHAMTWEVNTIFSGITNWVYGVDIINDTSIWVVGYFILYDPEDTLTSFQEVYNLIKWNGTTWELGRIMEPDWGSIAKVEAIYAISENDVWAGSYGGPMHWDGTKWKSFGQGYGWVSVGSQINAIWASGSDDVFFGSVNGQINHWDGSGFERMATPTELPLTDIWGTGPADVWAVGWSLSKAKSTVLHYDGVNWDLKYETGKTLDPPYTGINTYLSGYLKQVQTFQKGEAWILANTYGIYSTTIDSAPRAELHEIEFQGKILQRMRGNHAHDLYIGASYSGIFHYNGEDIYEYNLPGHIAVRGIAVKGDQVVMVGEDNWGVVAVRGRKVK